MERFRQMEQWIEQSITEQGYSITPASSDASFRRYFRVNGVNTSYIVMDAPPEQEDCRPFIAIAAAFDALGLRVPKVLASDLKQGFLLLDDLGAVNYLDRLNDDTVDRLYGDALSALAALQALGHPENTLLPAYDQHLLDREMALFPEWFLSRHLGLTLSDADQSMLHTAFTHLTQAALEQPKVWVHRDYHSRNLMVLDSHNPGILDFQDAVVGPVTYDLVSLLRDCYIAWPQQRVEAWAIGYLDLAHQMGILQDIEASQFLRWFDLMGVQRHLKAIGIFARLNHRDGKPNYLGDIPRTLGYVTEVSARYPELTALHDFIVKNVLPKMVL